MKMHERDQQALKECLEKSEGHYKQLENYMDITLKYKSEQVIQPKIDSLSKL
jgi:hypothetical protein